MRATGRASAGPGRSRGRPGELDDHEAALRLLLLDADLPAVQLNYPACDREPKAGTSHAPRASRVGSIEAFEDARRLLGRDPRPLVGDLDPEPFSGASCRDA